MANIFGPHKLNYILLSIIITIFIMTYFPSLAGMNLPPSKVALVANGHFQDDPFLLSRIESYPFIIAVDGGLIHCHRLGITPNLILGDLDSVSEDILCLYSNTPIQRYPRDKDQSDLELAVQWVTQNECEEITVFGGLGLRADHTLANLMLLKKYPQKLHFENEHEVVFGISGSNEIPCFIGQTISFFALSEVTHGVTSQGLKWELNETTFSSDFFSLSNVCQKNPVIIEIKQGNLVCCLQKMER
jgi:thiamine pyrophosphokinase